MDDKHYIYWTAIHSIINLVALIATVFYGFSLSIWIGILTVSFGVFIVMIYPSYGFSPVRIGYPNLVTILRLILLLVMVFMFTKASREALFVTSLILVTMDGVDGFLARKLNQSSKYGEILDFETDAQLVLFLSYIHFQLESAGIWILFIG